MYSRLKAGDEPIENAEVVADPAAVVTVIGRLPVCAEGEIASVADNELPFEAATTLPNVTPPQVVDNTAF